MRIVLRNRRVSGDEPNRAAILGHSFQGTVSIPWPRPRHPDSHVLDRVADRIERAPVRELSFGQASIECIARCPGSKTEPTTEIRGFPQLRGWVNQSRRLPGRQVARCNRELFR